VSDTQFGPGPDAPRDAVAEEELLPLEPPDPDDIFILEEPQLYSGALLNAVENAFPGQLSDGIRRRAWSEYEHRLRNKERARAVATRRRAKPLHAHAGPWFELAAVLGLVLAVNAIFFPDDPGFRRLEFNPYFAPVILMAVRFGVIIGLVGGILAAACVALPGAAMDLEDGSLVLPGLLVAVGTAVGAVSGRQGSLLSHCRSRNRQLRDECALAMQTVDAKDVVIGELQKRIEEHTVSIESLYRLSRSMGSTNRDEMYRAMLQILARDLKVERAAVYEIGEEMLTLRASHDARVAAPEFPPELPLQGGLTGLTISVRRVVSIFDEEAASAERTGSDTGVLCGPIFDDGWMRAVVLVQEMPLFEFSPVAVSRFSALLEWGQETCLRARYAGGGEHAA
jgi:hypothetical protein